MKILPSLLVHNHKKHPGHSVCSTGDWVGAQCILTYEYDRNNRESTYCTLELWCLNHSTAIVVRISAESESSG